MRTCELTNVQKVLHVLLTTHSILTIEYSMVFSYFLKKNGQY